jgi:hypothetical protein
VMTVEVAAGLPEAAPAAPTAAFVPAVLLVPLLHAPASSAAASGTPSLTGTGTRATHDFVASAETVFPVRRRDKVCATSVPAVKMAI